MLAVAISVQDFHAFSKVMSKNQVEKLSGNDIVVLGKSFFLFDSNGLAAINIEQEIICASFLSKFYQKVLREYNMSFQKLDVKIVMLGHAKRLVDTRKLQHHKSNFFRIKDVIEIEALPEKDVHDGYLNIEYSPERVSKILENESGSLVVGIMLYPYNDNFYMHRAGENKLCISLAAVNHILRTEKISIENFIIKNILEAVLLHKLFNGCNSDKLYEFLHSDTRGCIFDKNGNILDIIYNTEKPILCNECKGKIKGKSLPEGYLSAFEKELTKIEKTPSQKFESWVGKHPFQYAFLTLIVTAILTIGINIFTNNLCK